MARPFPIIDADGHMIERDRELREFLPDPTGGAQGKRRYALFLWDGWARGGLSPHRRCMAVSGKTFRPCVIRAKTAGCIDGQQ